MEQLEKRKAVTVYLLFLGGFSLLGPWNSIFEGQAF